jgi:hypothetical protein
MLARILQGTPYGMPIANKCKFRALQSACQTTRTQSGIAFAGENKGVLVGGLKGHIY